ncbi:MAG: DNA polymerase IV [Planctomycetota bacterium]
MAGKETRTILHMDLDAFFCSVEELLDPSLKGTAFAVGAPAEARGVLATASYAARKFGVHSAMPTGQALRLCPKLKIVSGRHGLYAEHSKKVMAVLAEATPFLEVTSIDEAYLDVTHDKRPGAEIAAALKKRIRTETGLPCSFGVASNKLVAKIATNVGKPDGLVVVPPGREAGFLAPLPMEMLWGAGPKTRERLAALGMRTIGDVARWNAADLERRFGVFGADLSLHANGLDDGPVEAGGEAKSVSEETTFPKDVSDARALAQTLASLCEGVAASLRKEGLAARTIRLKIRWPSFELITRQTTLPEPTDLESRIVETARALLAAARPAGKPVRLLGVAAANFSAPSRQAGLFDAASSRRQASFARALDRVRSRFGKDALRWGADAGDGPSTQDPGP